MNSGPTGAFTEQNIERVNYASWCGEKSAGHERHVPPGWTEYEGAFRPCPKCQSKMLSAKLKAEPIGFILGDRVDASDESNPYGVTAWNFKSVYPVIDVSIATDDERDRVVAFITIDNGWGKLWEVHPWERTTLSVLRSLESRRWIAAARSNTKRLSAKARGRSRTRRTGMRPRKRRL